MNILNIKMEISIPLTKIIEPNQIYYYVMLSNNGNDSDDYNKTIYENEI